MKSIAFFNNKGGVGKTSLVYHLAWMFGEQGKRVLIVDLDPQSNLTAMCLDEERLEQLWVDDDMKRRSIRGAVQPIIDGIGDIQPAHLESLSTRIALIPGDIRLSDFEVKLSDAWPRCNDRDPAAFRVVSSFFRAIEGAATSQDADVILIDVGPNLGAINRSALIASEYVVTPLGADLFSIQGLRNLGPTLNRWRQEWSERLCKNPVSGLSLPAGNMLPIGYVVMQPSMHGSEVARASARWLEVIPVEYAKSVVQQTPPIDLVIATDPYCLAVLKHYRSLMPLAQAARKPMFKLTPADGAMGAHAQAARKVGENFRDLAIRIATRIGNVPDGMDGASESQEGAS